MAQNIIIIPVAALLWNTGQKQDKTLTKESPNPVALCPTLQGLDSSTSRYLASLDWIGSTSCLQISLASVSCFGISTSWGLHSKLDFTFKALSWLSFCCLFCPLFCSLRTFMKRPAKHFLASAVLNQRTTTIYSCIFHDSEARIPWANLKVLPVASAWTLCPLITLQRLLLTAQVLFL